MNIQRWFPFLAGLVMIAAGCAPARLGNAASTAAPGAFRKTSANPASRSSFAPASLNSLENSCGLLNTRDFASLFPTHTETILPKPQISHVDHAAFSSVPGAGTETACVYYSYFLPGSRSGTVLQTNYWLDVPASGSAARAWEQAWAASQQGAQSLDGIADSAFLKDRRLSIKKGDTYVTVAATETKWNPGNPNDQMQQLAVETELAQDLVSRLP